MLTLWQGLLGGAIAIIVYTYLGYPLLLWAIARGRPTRQPPSAPLPTVTVVVAAYNEASCIRARLLNLLGQDYPAERLDVLVVADGCTDGTEAEVEAIGDPRIHLLSRPIRAGKVNALNAAIPLASGEVVVGSDANCFFAPDTVRQLVKHFGDPQVAMVAGAKRIRARGHEVAQGEGLYWRYEAWLKRLDCRVSTALGATGEVFALRKERFEPLPCDSIIEDFMLSMRLVIDGYRVVYEPAAIALEDASATLHDEFRRKVRIVAGGWQSVFRLGRLLWPGYGVITFQYVSHRVLRWLVTPLMLPLALVSNLVLAVQGQFRVLLALQLGFYLLALLGWGLLRRGRRWAVAYVPFYFVFLNWAALVGAYRYLTGRQPVTWVKARRLGAP